MQLPSQIGLRLSVCLLCVAMTSGCGGAVAVHSNFSGAANAAASPPAGAQGLQVSGGTSLAVAIVLGLMVVDGIDWVAARLRQTSAATQEPPPSGPVVPWIDRTR